MKIRVKKLYFNYRTNSVLKNINMEAIPGELTAIIGANAAGKTTLLKCISGILKSGIIKGKIFIDSKEINNYKQSDINRLISFFPQDNPINAALRVFEVILLGLVHSLSWRVSEKELLMVSKMMEDFNISNLASEYINEVSGGQRQLAFIAQSLVREPKILLMDEPTNNLDIQHQLEVLYLIRKITIEQNITTVIALHDLNLAARYANKLIILKDGTIYDCGTPMDVVTKEMIRTIYNVNASIYIDNDYIPQVIPKCSVNNYDHLKIAK